MTVHQISSIEVVEELKNSGYTYYDWNVSGEDSVNRPSVNSIVNNVLNIIQKGRSKEDRIAFNAKNWYNGIFGSYDHVYKGTIFIPVNEDYFTYSAAMGESLTPGQAEDIEARQQAAPREAAANKLYNNPGAFDD